MHRPAAAVVTVAAVMAAVASCGYGRTTSATVHAQATPLHTPGTLNSAPPPPVNDPWLAYLTHVNPGSGIRFAAADAGWRVDGQGSEPHLDMKLGAGPYDNTFGWPGSGVSRSTDGGDNWTSIRTENDGVWGIDLLSPDVGWVVGVTSLSRTVDGGASWQQLGEPSGKPLVTVAFSSASVGFGLTTDGRLMHSADGGASWDPANVSARGTAVCFGDPQDGYLTDERGALYVTHDGGGSWQADGAPAITIDVTPVWSQLSCDTQDVWQAVTVIDRQAHTALGDPYLVRRSGDGGSSWSVVAASSTDPRISVPAAPAPVAAFAGVAATTAGNAALAGFPASGWQLAVAAVGSGHGPATAQVPALARGSGVPADPDRFVKVHGTSFVGSAGWLFLDDGGVGTQDAPETETVLLHTTDGGASWSVQQQGQPQPVTG